jgi:hypothetical protein
MVFDQQLVDHFVGAAEQCGGTVRPNALVVFALIITSNLLAS